MDPRGTSSDAPQQHLQPPLATVPVPNPPPALDCIEDHPAFVATVEVLVSNLHRKSSLSMMNEPRQQQQQQNASSASAIAADDGLGGKNSSGTSQWHVASVDDDDDDDDNDGRNGGIFYYAPPPPAATTTRMQLYQMNDEISNQHHHRDRGPYSTADEALEEHQHEQEMALVRRDRNDPSSPKKDEDASGTALITAGGSRKSNRRSLLLVLPVDLWSYILGTYMPRETTLLVRLSCRWVNSIVEANCWCWECRLPPIGMFEDPAAESVLTAACRVRQWSASSLGFEELSIFDNNDNDDDPQASSQDVLPPHQHVVVQQQSTTWFFDVPQLQQQYPRHQRFHNSCQKGCCYRAWLANLKLEVARVERESIESEVFEYASVIAKAVFFPARAGKITTAVFVALASLSFSVALVLQYYRNFPKVLMYLPLWVFFGFLYPVLYFFFLETPIETLVAAVISTIGIVLSSLLQFFYREDSTSMSLLSCATPAMLCVASLATYAVLLCHRWFHEQNRRSIRVSVLAVLTATIPTLLLLTLALFAAGADGMLGLSSESGNTSPSTVPPMPPGAAPGAPLSPRVVTAYFSVQYAALPMILVSVLLFVNIVHVLTTFGSQDLLHGEPIATVVLLGYALTWVGLAVLSVFAFVGAETNVIFGFGLALASTFLGATVINAITPKEETSPFSHLLFRFPR